MPSGHGPLYTEATSPNLFEPAQHQKWPLYTEALSLLPDDVAHEGC